MQSGVYAANFYVSAIGDKDTGKQLHGGGFAGTVFAQQAQDFAAFKLQRDMAYHFAAAHAAG
jgi:hypothetical protein